MLLWGAEIWFASQLIFVIAEEFDRQLGGVIRLFGPYGPESFDAGVEAGYDDVLQFMNYGVLDVNAEGTLTASIKNVKGEVVFTLTLPATQ